MSKLEASNLPGVSAYLDRRDVNGSKCLGIRNTEYNLVRRNDEGKFEPVDSFTKSVTSEELEANYGVWQDKEITKGMWWWKSTVRPKDGKVDADEVQNFADFRNSQQSHRWSGVVGGDRLWTFDSANVEVKTIEDQPKAVLNTEWSLYRGDWNRYWEPMSPLAPPNR